jgi:predicted transcriptional regulator
MESVTSTTTALNQFLEPLNRTLGVEAARALVALQIEPKIQDRIEELAELCNEGLLTEADRTEYEAYVEGAEILALLRLKASR